MNLMMTDVPWDDPPRSYPPPSHRFTAVGVSETCNSLRSTWEISTLIVERHSSMTLVPS